MSDKNDILQLFDNQNIDPNLRLYSAPQLANLLDLSVHTIRKWKAMGRIPYRKLGRAIRYNLSEVVEAISERG